MPSIEISAKTLDEAKTTAADKLGVTVKDLTVTVLEESKGLFGKSVIKIRAEAKEPATPKAAKAKAAPKGKAAKSVEPEVEEVAPVEAVVEAPVEEAKPAKAAKAPARGKKPAKDAPATAAVEMEEKPAKGAETDDRPEVIATAEDEAKVREIIEGILASASLEAEIQSSERTGKYINVALDGRDVAHLVGKHGEVLNALQYLVNVIVTQRLHNGVRCTIDGNHYREKREEALTKLATNIANEVAKRGEEAVLDALPAFERRIVHKALSVIEGVTTYSEGEEPNRRVVIAPAE